MAMLLRGVLKAYGEPVLMSTPIRWTRGFADHFDVLEVHDDEENEDAIPTPVLCIAPPCGIKADAVDVASLPIEWKLRIAPV